MTTLGQALANTRRDAAVLRRSGHKAQAEGLERLCDQVTEAAEPWLRWLTEAEARLRSGRSERYLRGRFPEWQEQGNARLAGRERQYRMCVIEQRIPESVARERGRQLAHERLHGKEDKVA